MISHCLSTRKQEVKKFDRFSKFIVVGNGFDGMIDIHFLEYDNWESLKLDFPEKFRQLHCWGEWDLKIYQVPSNYKLIEKHKNYMIPNKGKEIAEYSYMEVGKRLDLFISNSLIHFVSETTDVHEKLDHNTGEIIMEASIYEEYKTIHLEEDLDDKEFTEKNYPGNVKNLYTILYDDEIE